MLNPEHILTLAKVSDSTEIASLSRTLIEKDLPWSWRPVRVAASIRHPETNVLVARIQNRISGFGIMRYGDTEAHLDLFGVDSPRQRQGIGQGLLTWLEKPARIMGISWIVLEVRAGNIRAQAFYEHRGYRKLRVISGYYSGYESAVRMGLRLR